MGGGGQILDCLYSTVPRCSSSKESPLMVLDGASVLSSSFLTILSSPSSSVVRRGLATKKWSGDRYAPNPSNNRGNTGNNNSMSNNRNSNNNNSNSSNNRGGGGKGSDSLKLLLCWSKYDLEAGIDPDNLDPDDEEYLYEKAKFDLKDIQEKVKEQFEKNKDIEYYDGNDWKPLKSMQELTRFKGGKTPLPLRIPSMYDDNDMDEDDDDDDKDYENGDDGFDYSKGNDSDVDDDYEGNNDDFAAMNDPVKEGGDAQIAMKRVITMLVDRLKSQGYQRASVNSLLLPDNTTSTTILTRDWILSQLEPSKLEVSSKDQEPTDDDDDDAQDNADKELLENVLLGQVGALDHITQCLHFDVVWTRLTMPDEDGDAAAAEVETEKASEPNPFATPVPGL